MLENKRDEKRGKKKKKRNQSGRDNPGEDSGPPSVASVSL